MSDVDIVGLRKTFGTKANPVVAVDDIDLCVEDGELLVLLGPSGCGKTTTLRCLAGLERPDRGRIAFGDRVVADADKKMVMPPEKRDIGMMFQNYALWPHMTVREIVAFPLIARGQKAGIGAGWIEETARLVECEHLLDRYPRELSGGQQQRIALARALVGNPSVMLFDEPLSNLDARLRSDLRAEIHDLHQRVQFTGLYVTHDQTEAMAIGDRVAIMKEGRVEQIGSPEDVFWRPRSEYVAEFFGVVNGVSLEAVAGSWQVRPSGGSEPGERSPCVHLRARPDRLRLLPTLESRDGAVVLGPATVRSAVYSGAYVDYRLDLAGYELRAHEEFRRTSQWDVGSVVSVAIGTDDVFGFDEGGQLIATDDFVLPSGTVVRSGQAQVTAQS